MTTPEEVEEAVKVAVDLLPTVPYRDYPQSLRISKAHPILSKLQPFLKAAMRSAEYDLREVDVVDYTEAPWQDFIAEYRALMAPPEVKKP